MLTGRHSGSSEASLGDLRVAQYHAWIYLKGGIERVIAEVCKRSHHHHTVFTNYLDLDSTFDDIRESEIIELSRVTVERDLWSVLRSAAIIGSQRLDLSSIDLLIVHSTGFGDFLLTKGLNLPVICLCHTPLRPAFDSEYQYRLLEGRNLPKRLAIKALATVSRWVYRGLWSRYDYVVFNSGETLRRSENGGLLRWFRGGWEILSPGVDCVKCRPSGEYADFFLVPGRIAWSKNVETAIQAFLLMKARWPEFGSMKLAVAGDVDRKSEGYLKELRALTGERRDVEYVVSPSDRELAALYSRCYAVVFPAFNEDWGIVPIEAGAYGKAVIATNQGGPRESVVDGQTGFLVNCDPSDFAVAMKRIAADPGAARRMGAEGRRNALKYDWSRFVGRLDNLVVEVLRGS